MKEKKRNTHTLRHTHTHPHTHEIFRGVFLYGFKTPKIVSKLPKNDLLKQKISFFVTKRLEKKCFETAFFCGFKTTQNSCFKMASMPWF